MTEVDLFEAIREAVRKQRVPQVDLLEFVKALRAAALAVSGAGHRAGEIVRANSVEDAAKLALPALKANEDAAGRIKALKQILLSAERTLGGNHEALRLAFGRALAGKESGVEDGFHVLTPLDGGWKLKVYSPDDVPWSYQKRVPDEERLRAALLERRPDDAAGVFEDPDIGGARLEQGEPSVKIALKRKQKRANG